MWNVWFWLILYEWNIFLVCSVCSIKLDSRTRSHFVMFFFFRNFLLSTSNELSLFGGANEIAFQNELLVWPVTNNKLLYGPTGRRRAMGQSKMPQRRYYEHTEGIWTML